MEIEFRFFYQRVIPTGLLLNLFFGLPKGHPYGIVIGNNDNFLSDLCVRPLWAMWLNPTVVFYHLPALPTVWTHLFKLLTVLLISIHDKLNQIFLRLFSL